MIDMIKQSAWYPLCKFKQVRSWTSWQQGKFTKDYDHGDERKFSNAFDFLYKSINSDMLFVATMS